jgi:hypothetical protein
MMDTISLHELQEQFTASLFDTDIKADSLPLKPQLEDKDQRLNIYRNNVFHSLSMALADLYPVVEQLFGEDFFKACARSYLQDHPPHTAAMVDFGATFPGFIQDFAPLDPYPWLADVARVELAWHESYHAADTPPMDPNSLRDIPAEQLSNSQLMMLPSVRLIRSAYPVYTIWQAHQQDHGPQETISLDKGEESLCVFRPKFDVLVKPLDTDSMLLLERLYDGISLTEAIESVLETSPGFNVEKALGEAFKDGLFHDIKEEKT